MSRELQSYTPIVHPLNYDSLASREGCEIETAYDVLGTLGFVNVCVFSHDDLNFRFALPDTISYQSGPDGEGVAGKQLATWTAWVDTAGVRYGLVGNIKPPSTLGIVAPLFPATKTTKITHCFDSNGVLHMAAEKPGELGFIEVKNGTLDVSFSGKSPLLFNLANLEPTAGVVCYYLRSDLEFTLLARFGVESFATEHIVIPALRVNLERLISIRSIGNLAKLYASDDTGRDATLTSNAYGLLGSSKTTLGVTFVSAAMTQAAVPTSDQSDAGQVTISFMKALMSDATAETVANPTEKGTMAVSFESAEMNAA